MNNPLFTIRRVFLPIIGILILQSCGSYRQSIMFQVENASELTSIDDNQQADKSYVIQPFDRIELEVYTKKGEFLIDPENKLLEQQNVNARNLKPELQYLVQEDGSVVLPMVGKVALAGLTISEVENKLIKDFEYYYKDPFVQVRYVNKRVIVLGAVGGQVVPITNENTKVTEILALTEGFEKEAKAQNIRLIRGDLVYQLDFSTIQGYKKSNMPVENGDILYIEPVKRPFTEFIRENGPVISIFTSLASLIAVLISIN